jgi:hypothetical protein
MFRLRPRGWRAQWGPAIAAFLGVLICANAFGVEHVKPHVALQRFELNQLRLIATYPKRVPPAALVRDPSGRAHIVRVGDSMGTNDGRVSEISAGEIVIEETITDPHNGRRFPDYIPMRLKATRR